MSSQFVDINRDGRKDILVGSYNGVPQWVENTADGWGQPENVLDQNGDPVLISEFWNYETEDWDRPEDVLVEGHCTSVAAVDWDADGDDDLLLGDYRNGRLLLRLNEGDAKESSFALQNQFIKVAGEPIAIEGGISAPRVVDWNGDGLFDIIIGSIQGGVYLVENSGTESEPKFDVMTTLIEPVPGYADAKTPKRVEARDVQPTGPGSSFHLEVVDYDGDGDLDLLVGSCCSWLTGPAKVMTPEREKAIKELGDQVDAAWREFSDFKDTVETKEEKKELAETDKYRELYAEYRRLRAERYELTRDPVERGDFIWLFRQK